MLPAVAEHFNAEIGPQIVSHFRAVASITKGFIFDDSIASDL